MTWTFLPVLEWTSDSKSDVTRWGVDCGGEGEGDQVRWGVGGCDGTRAVQVREQTAQVGAEHLV